ncbi:hypothetical protein CBF34_09960 [Vagococcus penaei]|uniref:UPF0298 protein BW732_02640 n=1 Tax=Vagococcus penaei TaxID=633807 RepID=A0A1Q2D4C9_9ENTE|nr:YlbG family protein [Vagococcus penaei]AQP53238.1 hypothetical protein BW732_02640 [Vagococcus penaei]RST98684.1 hypothetical protein CBF34_09960 [Vagococcus penaei]
MEKNKELDNFAINPRRSLIIWVYSLKQLKQLKRFGYVHYVSKKMKYVVLYIDEVDVDELKEKINRLFFVRCVELSYRPDINMNFDNRLGNKTKTKSGEPLEFEEQTTEIRLAECVD